MKDEQPCLDCCQPMLVMGRNLRCTRCGFDLDHYLEHLHYRILKPGDTNMGYDNVPEGTLLIRTEEPL
jgi:hypothetical protein